MPIGIDISDLEEIGAPSAPSQRGGQGLPPLQPLIDISDLDIPEPDPLPGPAPLSPGTVQPPQVPEAGGIEDPNASLEFLSAQFPRLGEAFPQLDDAIQGESDRAAAKAFFGGGRNASDFQALTPKAKRLSSIAAMKEFTRTAEFRRRAKRDGLVNATDWARKKAFGGRRDMSDALAEKELVSYIPFLTDLNDLNTILKVRTAALRLKADADGTEPLGSVPKRIDLHTLRAYQEKVEYLQARGATFGGKVTSLITGMIPFIGEFLYTSGLSAVVGTGAKRALRKLVKTGLKRKVLGETAKVLMAAAARTALNPPAVIAAQQQFALDGFVIDKDGRFRLIEGQEGSGLAGSIWKGAMSVYIERLTEELGEPLGKLVGRSVQQIPVLRGIKPAVAGYLKRVLGRFGDVWRKATGSTQAQYINKLATRAGRNSMLEEIGEERIGEILRFAARIDKDLKLADLDQIGQEIVGFGLLGIGTKGGGAMVGLANAKSNSRKDVAEGLGVRPSDLPPELDSAENRQQAIIEVQRAIEEQPTEEEAEAIVEAEAAPEEGQVDEFGFPEPAPGEGGPQVQIIEPQVEEAIERLRQLPELGDVQVQRDTDGTILIETPGGARANVVIESPESMAEFQQQHQAALVESAKQAGIEKPAEAELAGAFIPNADPNGPGRLHLRADAPAEVMSHEIAHWFREAGLIPEAEFREVLNRVGKGDFQGRRAEEAFAHAYQKWVRGESKPPGRIARIFQKIKNFIGGILGKEAPAEQPTFRAIREGKVAERPPVAKPETVVQKRRREIAEQREAVREARDERIFEERETRADQVLAEQRAKAPPKPKPIPKELGAKNKIVTRESAEESRKALRDIFKRLQTGPPVDAIPHMVKLGVFHFEAGARSFADWSKRMIADLGAKAKPLLRKVWNQMKDTRERIEGQERADQVQEPENPTPTDSMPLLEDMPDARVPNDAPVMDLMDEWLADRDESETEADIRLQVHQDQLSKLAGERRYGPKSKRLAEVVHTHIDLTGRAEEQMAKFGETVPESKKKLVAESQNLSPEVKAFADMIRKENAEIGRRAKDAEVIINVLDNYVTRLWRKPGSAEGQAALAKFTQSTGRSKRRRLESVVHGWSLDFDLAVQGVAEAQALASKQVDQVIHDRNFVKLGVKSGIFSEKALEGFKRVDHPNFTTWKFRANINEEEAQGRNFFTTDDGQVFERVALYADKKLATHLNNIFRESGLLSVPLIPTLKKWNDIIKQQILFTTLFHPQALMRSYTLASRAINPFKGFELGKQIVQANGPLLRDLVRGGMTLFKVQDFDFELTRQQTIIGAVLDKVPMARGTNKALNEIKEEMTKYIFHRMLPYLKAQSGLLEYIHILKKNAGPLRRGEITRHDLAKQVARLQNADFGGLNLRRKGRNPTVQLLFSFAALAPDWTESNVLTYTRAFRLNKEAPLYRAMWGRVLLKGLTATVLFNALISIGDDDDMLTAYEKAWDDGRLRWLSVNLTSPYRALGGHPGKRKYFKLLGHFLDPIRWTTDPLGSIKNKASWPAKAFLAAILGRDWADRPFTNYEELLGIDDKGRFKNTVPGKHRKGEPKGGRLKGKTVRSPYTKGGPLKWEQFPSWALNNARGTLPIPAQAGAAFLAGEIDMFDFLTRAAGFATSTTYPKPKKKPKTRKGGSRLRFMGAPL